MIKYMGHLKRVFDPKGILNPYKVLPESTFRAWNSISVKLLIFHTIYLK